jgi:hypothetical protein
MSSKMLIFKLVKKGNKVASSNTHLVKYFVIIKIFNKFLRPYYGHCQIPQHLHC